MAILNQGGRERTRVKEDAINNVVNQIAFTFKRLTRIQRELNRSIWYDPQFTPEEILLELDRDAEVPMIMNERLMNTIERLSNKEGIPVEIDVPPFDYVKNPNGTVVVDRLNAYDKNTK